MPRGSIIGGARNIPGGARPTPGPQNTYAGNISPLQQQLASGGAGWAQAYQSYLPRPSKDFTEGAFGPLSPIIPVPVDAPPEGGEFAEPRLFEYEVGWNLPVGQPGTEGIKLADFNTLRTLADLYSVARAAIQLRKAEVRGIEWDILPTHDAAKAMRGDHKGMKDFGERRIEALRFFRRPDPDYFSWDSWIDAVMEEILVFDALSILIRPKWMKGKGKGLFGSDLDSLSLISGQTIRPLLDLHGARPRPPAPAYQQYLYGVPRSDIMTMITEKDIEDGDMRGAEMGKFRTDQLLYLPMVNRRWTPYGFPPIERALIPVMSGLQKQGFQLDYFREGTVPAVYISPGGTNANMTPNQIRELQDALNAIAGDPAYHHKIIVLPADSKVHPQRQADLADAFDEVVMSQVCMAFDVQPMELGIMPKVSSTVTPGAAHQMGKATQGIQERKATKPTLTFLAGIMNVILQDMCGQHDMRFVFEGLEEKEDEETKTKMLVAQVGASLRSIDEARQELNLQPWGIPETSDPGWATPGGGWIPLAQAVQAFTTGLEAGPELELPDGVTPAQQGSAMQPQGGDAPQGGGTSAPASSPATQAKPARKPGSGPKNPAAEARSKPAPAAAKPAAKPADSSPGHTEAAAATAATKPAAKKTTAKKPAASTKMVESTVQRVLLDADKTKAVLSELDALSRHLKKGRHLDTWETRHITSTDLGMVSHQLALGLEPADAVKVVASRRLVNMDGQVYWEDFQLVTSTQGGGGRIPTPHDEDGTETDNPVPYDEGRVAPGGKYRADVQPRWEPNLHDPGSTKGKKAWESPDPSLPTEAQVYRQLIQDFPAKAIAWVHDVPWEGPRVVPVDRFDFSNMKSWSAYHEQDKVDEFAARIQRRHAKGKPIKPIVAVLEPGKDKLTIVDGHHRALAAKKLGVSIEAFIGHVPTKQGPWLETHASQYHLGDGTTDFAATKSEKVSKESVNYRMAVKAGKRCGTCSMFRSPNSCTLVEGMIEGKMVCDKWDPADGG